MTPIAELRELHAKATPGEWRGEQDGMRELMNITAFIKAGRAMVTYGHLSFEDRDFIVAAHTHLPALIDLAERAQAAAQRCADMQAIVMDTIEKRRNVYIEKQKRADPMADDDRNQHDCLRDRIMALDYLASEMEAALAQTGRG